MRYYLEKFRFYSKLSDVCDDQPHPVIAIVLGYLNVSHFVSNTRHSDLKGTFVRRSNIGVSDLFLILSLISVKQLMTEASV